MTPTRQRIALVTGANRGIGLAVCRQLARKGLKVILTGRDAAAAEGAAAALTKEKLDVLPRGLDVTDPQAAALLEVLVRREWGRLDVLVNNAAFYHDTRTKNSASTVDIEMVRASMETNLYGPLRLCQTFLPLMKENNYGRIVNVSTSMAQLTTMTGGWPAYRFSKVALNGLSRMLADEVRGSNILVNSMSPGWVRTDMGGPDAPRSAEEGAETIVWLATLPEGGPSGGFFLDKKSIDW